MFKKYFIISSLSLSIFLPQSVFGLTGNILQEDIQTQTIRQIQESIVSLEQEKTILDFKWDNYRIGNATLGELIRKDFTDIEKNFLNSLILNYNNRSSYLENQIQIQIGKGNEEVESEIGNLKKEILREKQNFYTSLLPYIQASRLKDFRTYIEGDLEFFEKSRNVSLEIDKKNIKKSIRVEELGEKALNNSKILRDQISQKISEKVEKKLKEFISQEKFQKLPNTVKIELFQKLVIKLEILLADLEKISNPTTIIQEKIFLYHTVENILESFIFSWK